MWRRLGGGRKAAADSFHYPHAGSVTRSIPKGLQPPAQGWRPAPTLGVGRQTSATPTGLCPAAGGKDTTPLGLTPIPTASPRVARAAQPWALVRNSVGIQTPARGESWVIHRDDCRTPRRCRAFTHTSCKRIHRQPADAPECFARQWLSCQSSSSPYALRSSTATTIYPSNHDAPGTRPADFCRIQKSLRA